MKAPDTTPLRIVSIGGGSGLSVLLKGLKRYAHPAPGGQPRVDITAVVTVSDDGGSSGRLRRDFDVPPPGDIRNCLVALSEDETLLARLFQYRFRSGRGLKGHSFGNLFLAALTDITGDFHDAIELSSEVLAIAGRIFPSTYANTSIEATLADGNVVRGESLIGRSKKPIESVRLIPKCRAPQGVLDAIAQADLITLGPGSLYTSVVPNLLVGGIPQALRKSPATVAYFVNLMWQPGETMNYCASDHVRALHRHAGGKLIDCAIVNIAGIRPALRKKYASQKAQPVSNDSEVLFRMGLQVVAGDLVSQADYVRHDAERIADMAVRLALDSRRKRKRGS